MVKTTRASCLSIYAVYSNTSPICADIDVISQKKDKQKKKQKVKIRYRYMGDIQLDK